MTKIAACFDLLKTDFCIRIITYKNAKITISYLSKKPKNDKATIFFYQKIQKKSKKDLVFSS